MTKAHGPLFLAKFRRRRQGRTNFEKRYRLLKSGRPRLVVRKTNARVLAEFVRMGPKGDEVLASATSTDLVKLGFAGRCNTPSAYLVGLLAGRRAAKAGVKEFVLDIGLHKATKGSLVFATAKGALDAGLQSALDEEMVPSAERISGAHLHGLTGFNEAKNKVSVA